MTVLVVRREELVKNVQIVIDAVAPAQVIGVVKGNGYGLGLVQFAKTLLESGVRMLAVATLMEGVALRRAGVECDILLLSPLQTPDEAALLLEHRIIATVSSYDSAVMLNGVAEKADDIARVHIKADTGFGRFGFLENECEKIVSIDKYLKNISIEGIYSHFHSSFARSGKSVSMQIEAFERIIDQLEKAGVELPMKHIANSCAALRYETARFDAVRIGSAFLGRLPIENTWQLSKIGVLEDTLYEIRWLPAHHNVGYGSVYRTKRPTRIAVVQTGYISGLGLERSDTARRPIDILRFIWHDIKRLMPSAKKYVTVKGQRAPILGRVSMCNMVIDVTDIDCVSGDKAIMQVNPLMVDSLVPRRYE